MTRTLSTEIEVERAPYTLLAAVTATVDAGDHSYSWCDHEVHVVECLDADGIEHEWSGDAITLTDREMKRAEGQLSDALECSDD